MSYGVLSPFGLYLSLALRLEIDIGRQGMTYLTYFLEVRVEQRALTADRKRILFCASLVIGLQVFPSLFSSLSQDRLHEVLGRPIFLFPCRFHPSACMACYVIWAFSQGVPYPSPFSLSYLLFYGVLRLKIKIGRRGITPRNSLGRMVLTYNMTSTY